MSEPQNYCLANQCENWLRVLIHSSLVKFFYSCMRWNQNITYKRRLSMLLLYKSHIAVVCSKISQTTKQKQINIELKKVWRAKAKALAKTRQATKWLAIKPTINTWHNFASNTLPQVVLLALEL